MSYLFSEISFSKSYASRANAEKAVTKALGEPSGVKGPNDYLFRVAIMPAEGGRFGVMIFGTNEKDGSRQAAIQVAMRYGFNVIA